MIKGHEEDIDTFAIIGPIAGIFMSVIFLLVFFLVDARCKKVREIKLERIKKENGIIYCELIARLGASVSSRRCEARRR